MRMVADTLKKSMRQTPGEATRKKDIIGRYGGEEFIGDIGHNKADGPLLARAEAAGGGVRRVAQLPDGLVDTLFRLVRNIAGIIDGVGNRGGGNTCCLRNLLYSNCHSSSVREKRLRKRFSHIRLQNTP